MRTRKHSGYIKHLFGRGQAREHVITLAALPFDFDRTYLIESSRCIARAEQKNSLFLSLNQFSQNGVRAGSREDSETESR